MRTVTRAALGPVLAAVCGIASAVVARIRTTSAAVSASVCAVTARARTAGSQAGMSTAEYAVGLVAACAFAAVLYKILTSGTMQALLRGLISRALHVTL